jgi:hypothetical protein
MTKRVFQNNEWKMVFGDPREFWNSLSKYEVTKDFENNISVYGASALTVAICALKKDVAYGQVVETKHKGLGDPQIDGVFDIQVKNATYARLTTQESSETFTPIEFINKDGVLVLEGCDLNHPLFLPHSNIYCRVEKFKIETDANTIQYRQFVINSEKLKQFFTAVVENSFPSIFANERVVLASLGSISHTFQLNESKTFKGVLISKN